MPQSVTFGGISCLHLDKTRELIDLESPRPRVSALNIIILQQGHQLQLSLLRGVSAPSPTTFLICGCAFIRGTLTLDIQRAPLVQKSVHFSPAPGVRSSAVAEVVCQEP